VKASTEMEVLLCAINESPSSDLAKIAIRRGWPVLQIPVAAQTLDEVRRLGPAVVIVQVSMGLGEDLNLLYLLRTNLSRISLIAVATAHCHEVERSVRSVGVSCYLPSARDGNLVEQAVRDMVNRHERNTVSSADAKGKPARRETEPYSSASFNASLKYTGRRAYAPRRPLRPTKQEQN